MPTWRIGRKYTVAHQFTRLNYIGDLGLLEDPQIKVGLIHPVQSQLKSPIPPILCVIRTKMDNGLPDLSCPFTSLPFVSPLGLHIPN